jgi:hypothetical protein
MSPLKHWYSQMVDLLHIAYPRTRACGPVWGLFTGEKAPQAPLD